MSDPLPGCRESVIISYRCRQIFAPFGGGGNFFFFQFSTSSYITSYLEILEKPSLLIRLSCFFSNIYEAAYR